MDPLYPDAAAPPVLVHVTAPATLVAGYTFEAQINGDPNRTFTAEVVRSLLFLSTYDLEISFLKISLMRGFQLHAFKSSHFPSLFIVAAGGWCFGRRDLPRPTS